MLGIVVGVGEIGVGVGGEVGGVVLVLARRARGSAEAASRALRPTRIRRQRRV